MSLRAERIEYPLEKGRLPADTPVCQDGTFFADTCHNGIRCDENATITVSHRSSSQSVRVYRDWTTMTILVVVAVSGVLRGCTAHCTFPSKSH